MRRYDVLNSSVIPNFRARTVMQAGPNLLLCPDARAGGLWGTPGSSTLQLGKRTAGAQSSLEMQEHASETVSEQVSPLLCTTADHP